MSRNQKSYSKLVVAFVVTCILGWTVTMTAIRTGAQWHPASEQKGYEAWGTVVEKREGATYVAPNKKGDEKDYGYFNNGLNTPFIYVKFKTESGVTFVIPFRVADIEAIPEPREAKDVDRPATAAIKEHDVKVNRDVSGGSISTACNPNGCTAYPPLPQEVAYTIPAEPAHPATHTHITAIVPHGILRYHLCDGSFYCFDSWEDK